MTGKYKTILIYCILILLAVALVTYGAFINSKKVSSPEEEYAQKLAELKADLIKASEAGRKQQQTSGDIKRKSTGKSPKARPT